VPVTLGIRTGASSLLLPERPTSPADAIMRPLDPPFEPPIPEIEMLRPGSGGSRTRTYDPATGITETIFDWDIGGAWKYENGIVWEDSSITTMRIKDDDPLSAEVIVENTSLYEDGELTATIVAHSEMRCTATDYLVSCTLTVHENGTPLLDRTWDYVFPRDHN
jgi:hypothetical protein